MNILGISVSFPHSRVGIKFNLKTVMLQIFSLREIIINSNQLKSFHRKMKKMPYSRFWQSFYTWEMWTLEKQRYI